MVAKRRLLAPIMILLAIGQPPTELEGQRPQPRELRREAGDARRLVLRQVLRLGSEDGDHDAFGRVMDAAFGGSGRIYLADDRNFHVAVFEGDGRFVGHIGRQGNGPGEFSRPWTVAADARDTVFVWDGNHSRISVFGPDLRYVRSFGTDPRWLVTELTPLPDGRLLLSAYGRGADRSIHLLDRGGTILRSLGPAIPDVDLSGFESSLLGGSVALGGRGMAYASKSPYEITYLDGGGSERARCRATGVTTEPQSVIVSNEQGVGLQWSRFILVSGILSLGSDIHLVTIRDPIAQRTLLDVVGPGCTLLGRSFLPGPASFADRRGNRVLVIRNVDVPQVVVYEYSLREAASPSPPRRRPR